MADVNVKRGVKFVVLFLLLAVVLSMSGLAAMFFMLSRAPAVSSNSVLMLSVPGGLSERQTNPLLTSFVGDGPTVQSVVESLRKAKVDKRVRGIILRPLGPQLLWGKAQEIRDAVFDYRRSGKPIVAFLEYGGTQEYYLASAADKVFLMPGSPLDLVGVASYEMFVRGALDKVGAYPDMLNAGDFKTAANFYTETTMTPAHREMAESLNHDLYEQIIDGIAEGRDLGKAEVRRLVDDGPFLPVGAYHIDVRHQQKRLGRAVAGKSGDEVFSSRRELRCAKGNLCRRQFGCADRYRSSFVAGRVGGIGRDERFEQRPRCGGGGIEVGC